MNEKVLYPTGIEGFDEAINSFNYFLNRGDKTMAKVVLREWDDKVERIYSRLNIMRRKLLGN